jgi:RNA polymerase sigma-B factor
MRPGNITSRPGSPPLPVGSAKSSGELRMTSLLRQWQLLEVLMTTLVGPRALARTVVWNLEQIDGAIAVAIAHLHYLVGSAGVVVFHSGPAPPRGQIDWPKTQLRGLPPVRWLEEAPGPRGRLRPTTEVLQSVVLAEPSGPVDLLICSPSEGPRSEAWGRLRPGGFVVTSCPRDTPSSEFEAVGPSGQLYRKVNGSVVSHREDPCLEPSMTLAGHQDQSRLIAAHIGLARSLARRFAHRGERTDDLEQVAYLALVKAAARFDPAMGRPFSAFAAPSIVGELKRHFRDKMWMVRVPRSVQEMHLAIRQASEELAHKYGCSPKIEDIAAYLEATEEEVLFAIEATSNSWATSLDSPAGGDQEGGADLPVPDAGFELSINRALLQEAAARLSPVEQLILRRVFFDEKTQREVAAELGLSQMQVSRLMTKTLGKLRQEFEAA